MLLNAKDICGGLRETSISAVLSIGEPELSPGLPHREIFYVTDSESLEILDRVMAVYEPYRDSVRIKATLASSSRDTAWWS